MVHVRRGRATAVCVAMAMCCGMFAASAAGAVVHVATTGADTNDGVTWATARKSVTAGLVLAKAGDQVWVAAGTYSERITLKAGVALYGGFSAQETQLGERDIRGNVTVLDGGQAGSVVTAPSGLTIAARIDGFTIRNGTGTVIGGTNGYGGGITCDHSAPTIANNIILANTPPGTTSYGGGIYCDAASPVIHGNAILANMADVGGGVLCRNASAPLIANNTFVANAGSAIVCETASTPTIMNNIVAFNVAGVVVSESTPVVGHNCVYNPDGADYTGVDPGTGDIAVDPLLAAFDYGEVHLLPGSPCIDAGDDAAVAPDWLEFDGQARLRFQHVDIGADEYDGTPTEFAPPIIHVSTTGDDASDGTTWVTAKRTVQAGITAAATFPGGEVWVAAGNYTQRLVLPPWVHLYGGFAGTEFDRGQRDPATHVTTLDGAAGGSVITVTAGFRISRIDGFTIRNGTGTLSGNNRYGGGIYCARGAPVITGNIITANAASNGYGGGIYCHLYAPFISGNTLTANSALSGGGLYCSSCAPMIADNTLSANSATNGGAIFCTAAAPTITRNLFTSNTATGVGNGGAINCSSSSPVITSNTFVSNTANNGIGAGIFCQTNSAPLIANSTFAANTAGSGGGIGCVTASPTIVNNVLAGNAAGAGGAIYVATNAAPTLANNTLIGNTATSTSTAAAGIHCLNASPVVAGNIVAFNASGLYRSGGTPVLTNNCVYNPGGFDYSGLTAGTGDISADPLLAGVSTGDVHLLSNSPCINAGDATVLQAGWVDLDGEARTLGGGVDMGADEFNGTPPVYAPRVVFVSPTGHDADDGSTWATAKATVQAAIDAALNTGGEIWIAAGTYTQRATLRPRVQVYGGFAGTETARDQRDPTTHVTILDGNAGGSVVSALLGWRISGLDGCTIRNGTGTLSSGNRLGGGVYCLNAAPLITSNVITANTIATGNGGGVYCSGFSPLLAGNLISGNSAPAGGGVYCANGAFPLIANNRIAGNTATSGGGMYCSSAAPTIVNNVIAGNGATACGGLYCFSAAPVVVNNTIVGNSASDFGALYCANASSPTVANNLVAFNSSGVHRSAGSPVLRSNCIYNPGGVEYSGLSAGTGDISSDPLLVAPDYGEVHLSAGSPCIDAGLDTDAQPSIVDLDGQTRIQAAHVDIGADEFDGVTPSFLPRVICVSLNGNDSRDGLSWATAKRTVQAGIEAAWTAGGEVWVGTGVFEERIVLRPWAYVYGGFAGVETDRDQRDRLSHASILDGGASGSVVTAQAGGRTCGLDGFTIRNGTGTLSGSNRLGGGVYCAFSSPRIANNTITANTATTGGGVYCTAGAPIIADNTITGNTATGGGGVATAAAGTFITGNLITANSVTSGNGGGVHCASGTPTLFSNRIVRNTATSSNGGGVYCSAAATLTSNLIAGNVGVNGAAIYCSSASPKITNTVFVGNRATAFGGVMYNLTSSPALVNCTLAYNVAVATTGLHNNGSNPALKNCILWGHTGTIISNLSSSTPSYSHSDVQFTVSGSGVINSDPKFKRLPTAGADGIWGTSDDDYGDLRLKSGSPGIDAGANADVPASVLTDRDGQARFMNDVLTADCPFAPGTCGSVPIVDMGAYEFGIPGDVDHDGDVDGDDLDALNACTLGPALPRGDACVPADFDRDGDVDQSDFAVWQRCYRAPDQPINPDCAG